jgi:hypothetical protein
MNQQSLETTRRNAAAKLHPAVLTTTTFVRSILGYLVGETWTDPYLTALACDADGYLYAQEDGNPFFGRVLCTRLAVIETILQLTHAVELSPRERTYLLQRIPPPIRRSRRSVGEE